MDLAKHRTRWLLRGLPIYDTDGEPYGVITEPEWAWGDLTEDQQATIRQEAIRCQGPNREITWHHAFYYVLCDYGVACPHEWRYTEPVWRDCLMCRLSEPLPGVIVRVGDRELRVPDPPPPYLKVPRPATVTMNDSATPSATIDVDEYRWTGSHYVLQNVQDPDQH